jgi:acyl-CoA dehydrogenase
MINYATNQVHYHHMRVPAACGVDEVDGGSRYVIDATQSASCSRPRPSATAHWFIDRAVDYATKRDPITEVGVIASVCFALRLGFRS